MSTIETKTFSEFMYISNDSPPAWRDIGPSLLKRTLIVDQETKNTHAFIDACRNGRLDDAKKIACDAKISKADMMYNNCCTFVQAVLANHLDVAKWLAVECKMTKSDFSKSGALHQICRDGHMDTLKWFIQLAEYTRQDILNDCLIHHACGGGQAPMATYLIQEIKTTRDEIVSSICYTDSYTTIFEAALHGGDLDLAKSLRDKFNLTDTEINTYAAYSCVVASGSLDIVRWLTQLLKPDRDKMLNMFDRACYVNAQKVAKWIYDEIKVTRKELLRNDNGVFMDACERGNLEIAKWIASETKMTKQEMSAQNNYAIIEAFERGRDDVVAWLLEQGIDLPPNIKQALMKRR